MAEPAPKVGMTVGKFFAHDDGTDIRYELGRGEMIAMNPPDVLHVPIMSNVFQVADGWLLNPCRAYFGGGVWIAETDDTWRDPDVFVSCGGREGLSQAPRLISELLTPSTETEDRTRTLDVQEGFASVEAILFVKGRTRSGSGYRSAPRRTGWCATLSASASSWWQAWACRSHRTRSKPEA